MLRCHRLNSLGNTLRLRFAWKKLIGVDSGDSHWWWSEKARETRSLNCSVVVTLRGSRARMALQRSRPLYPSLTSHRTQFPSSATLPGGVTLSKAVFQPRASPEEGLSWKLWTTLCSAAEGIGAPVLEKIWAAYMALTVAYLHPSMLVITKCKGTKRFS